MCYIDTFLVQAFKVDKMNFRGKWELASQETVITLGELIGKGGMRECYTWQRCRAALVTYAER